MNEILLYSMFAFLVIWPAIPFYMLWRYLKANEDVMEAMAAEKLLHIRMDYVNSLTSRIISIEEEIKRVEEKVNVNFHTVTDNEKNYTGAANKVYLTKREANERHSGYKQEYYLISEKVKLLEEKISKLKENK